MTVQRWIVGFGVLALASSAVVISRPVVAQDVAPTTAPVPDAAGAPRVRLPADYAALADLSDDEKAKLLAIRENTDQAIRDLRAKEAAEMEAALTDAQRAQLKEIDDKQQSAAKAARAQERLQQRIETNQDKLNALKEKADDPGANP